MTIAEVTARAGGRVSDVIERLRPLPRVPPARRRGADSEVLSGNGQNVGQSDLIRRRAEAAREFAAAQLDLGGLVYEMASRDHYRLDVLTRQAARLQQLDAELGQLERLVRMEGAGAAGSCNSCGALQARGAVFCWQCGAAMVAGTPPPEAAAAG